MNLKKNMKGFTLIELLIVIAILGALAAVILVALNPLQQLGKTRDATRLNTVASLGHSLEAFVTGNNAQFLTLTGTGAGCDGVARAWMNCLTSANGGSGDLTAVPVAVPYTLAYGGQSPVAVCTAAVVGNTSEVQNGFCYRQTGASGPAIIYTRAEAASNNAKCAPSGAGVATAGWFVYSTADGRAGVVCSPAGTTTEPSAGVQTFVN